MLVEFTVGNYRSFRERQTFSMEATTLKSAPAQRHLDESNVIQAEPKLQLLTSAAMYGANASGKSNLVRALKFMRNFVRSSANDRQSDDPTGVEPFLLSIETEQAPSHFEVVFLIDKWRFRYGFEATSQYIVSEWLHRAGTRGEVVLFERRDQSINVNARSFHEGQNLEERTRENALFLSVVAQFNGEIAKTLLRWFRQLATVSGLDDTDYKGLTDQAMTNGDHRAEIVRFVRQLDVNIADFSPEEKPIDFTYFSDEFKKSILTTFKDLSINSSSTEYKTSHYVLDTQGKIETDIKFDLNTQESDGTRKLFYLSGVILGALRAGLSIFIDELDARLHPQMTCAIVQLFNNKESNPHGAQLIFTTHDTNLLSSKLFRRDQIWFAEKDDRGGTNLYSLAEYQLEDGGTARNDANLEANYIRGKFGAIPFLGDLRRVVADVVAHDSNSNESSTPETVTDTEAEQAA